MRTGPRAQGPGPSKVKVKVKSRAAAALSPAFLGPVPWALGPRSTGPYALCLTASNKHTPAATETFRLSTPLAIGMRSR